MWVVSVILAYLIGSISSSTLISRTVARIDIREHGSGNAGATNTLRVLGLRWGLIVLAADVAKGLLALVVAHLLSPSPHFAPYVVGLAVIIGHNWPVFFGFRGGKGIATTIGVLCWLITGPALAAGGVAVVLLVLTRYVSLAALSFTVLTPVFAAVFHLGWVPIVCAALIAIMSLYRHKQNIVRLVKHEEHRLFSKSKNAS